MLRQRAGSSLPGCKISKVVSKVSVKSLPTNLGEFCERILRTLRAVSNKTLLKRKDSMNKTITSGTGRIDQ